MGALMLSWSVMETIGARSSFSICRDLQIEGQLGSHGRRPVAGRVVDAHAVHLLGPPFQAGEQRAHHRILVAKVGQEIQGLARLVGVTVQRNTGPESLWGPPCRATDTRLRKWAFQLLSDPPSSSRFPQPVSPFSRKFPVKNVRIALQLMQLMESRQLPEIPRKQEDYL